LGAAAGAKKVFKQALSFRLGALSSNTLTMQQLLTILLVLALQPSFAQEVIKLYDGPAPGSEDWDWSEGKAHDNGLDVEVTYNVTTPTLEVYLPSEFKATGTAVIIAPGGGFRVLAMEHEGREVARWLAEKGIAAFVLKYRIGHTTTGSPFEPEKPTGDRQAREEQDALIVEMALADGLKAMEYVRANSAKYSVKPDQVGFLGFSAGGTVTLSVAYNAENKNRPNFIVPIYAYEAAVIGGQVPTDTTPVFITVAGDDEYGMMPMSINIYEKWSAAGQPAELHVYERGGHGFGMNQQGLPIDGWYERLADWLRSHGLRKKRNPNKYEILYGEEKVEKGQQMNLIQLSNDFGGRDRYRAANAALKGKPAKGRVVLIGNSITDAWARLDTNFFARNNFVGRGISGQTSPQLLIRFRQDVVDLQPETVVIHIGTNDVAENTGPYDRSFTLGNIESMIDLAEAYDIDVVLASVLPATQFQWRRELGDRSADIVRLNEGIQQLAARRGLRYLDYHSALKNDQNGMDKDLAEDGVHPTMKAYGLMGKLLVKTLK
jgi:lysophospholipase L1-like esterase/acetyl esterase/lipase